MLLQLLILLLQEITCLSSLGELLVNELVLPRQSLDIFSKFFNFLGFHLDNLRVVLFLLPEILVLLA